MKQELAPRGVGIPVLQGREDVKTWIQRWFWFRYVLVWLRCSRLSSSFYEGLLKTCLVTRCWSSTPAARFARSAISAVRAADEASMRRSGWFGGGSIQEPGRSSCR